MMSDLALIAGSGSLPVTLSAAYPQARCYVFEGMSHDLGSQAISQSFNTLGRLFEDLHQNGIRRVVMAGAMSRPILDPSQFDPFMTELAPRLMQAFQEGDDGLLRFVVSMFEDQGIAVIGAHELLSDLTIGAGLLVGELPDSVQGNIEKADNALRQLSTLDVGQGVVVENGLILGIETLQGTDALLSFVAQTADHLRHQPRGIFVKRPKLGQELRVDMPTIGPDTVVAVANAGLSGIVVSPKSVVILDREQVLSAAQAHNIFILAQEMTP